MVYFDWFIPIPGAVSPFMVMGRRGRILPVLENNFLVFFTLCPGLVICGITFGHLG
jgi:hypothetical protein